MTDSLPRLSPEAAGLPSRAVLDLLDAGEARGLELHSLMVLRHGNVIAEGWWNPYRPETPHLLHSLSKSFTSTAVGLAVGEGRFGLDDPVLRFFPDEAPVDPPENLRRMRVRDLLTMTTGHDADDRSDMVADPDGNWMRAFLARPVPYAPGTHFLYNSSATYALSAIVTRVTGLPTVEYLRPRLFDPLGIGETPWETDPKGISVGGWGLSLRTEDIARFGQLYLQDGVWQGRRLLPEGWAAQATSAQVPNDRNENPDWRQGYGFQFWRCRHDAYRGDGAFGQNCVVVPHADLVVVTTAGVDDLQALLDFVWAHLLPALSDGPLPADSAADVSLRDRLKSLELTGPSGTPASVIADRVMGRWYRRTEGDSPFDLVRLDPAPKGTLLTLRAGHREHTLAIGDPEWLEGRTDLEGGGTRAVAARGAWASDGDYVVRLAYLGLPAGLFAGLRFEGETLRLSWEAKARFAPLSGPTFLGSAVDPV